MLFEATDITLESIQVTSHLSCFDPLSSVVRLGHPDLVFLLGLIFPDISSKRPYQKPISLRLTYQ